MRKLKIPRDLRHFTQPYAQWVALGVDERAVREWMKLERIAYCMPPDREK